MFDDKAFVDDGDRRIHDEVFIQSIDRKDRLARYLISGLGIPEADAREEALMADILNQLIREDNPAAAEIYEDTFIFLAEQEEEPLVPEFDTRGTRANSIYDRVKAKAYIDSYWKSYNSYYPSFKSGGGDCTNFVSQMLYAGGMPWVDDGNPANHRKSANWYCKPGATSKDSERRISFSWKLAALFKAHWIKRAEAHRMLSYSGALLNMNYLSKEVYIGDVVQFCYASGVPYHTLAVTGFNRDPQYDVNDIVLASHDVDSNTRSLYRTMLKYPSDYKLRVYNIRKGP